MVMKLRYLARCAWHTEDCTREVCDKSQHIDEARDHIATLRIVEQLECKRKQLNCTILMGIGKRRRSGVETIYDSSALTLRQTSNVSYHASKLCFPGIPAKIVGAWGLAQHRLRRGYSGVMALLTAAT